MVGWMRAFGDTGLTVSALGFGAGHVGSPDQDEQTIGRLLNEVVDAGITLIDTARGYGLSEERIGRHLSHRRDEIVISTKVGYDIPGHEDWRGPTITAGVEAALQRLQTDYLDIVHLHSCPLDVLQRGEVTEALQRAVERARCASLPTRATTSRCTTRSRVGASAASRPPSTSRTNACWPRICQRRASAAWA